MKGGKAEFSEALKRGIEAHKTHIGGCYAPSETWAGAEEDRSGSGHSPEGFWVKESGLQVGKGVS